MTTMRNLRTVSLAVLLLFVAFAATADQAEGEGRGLIAATLDAMGGSAAIEALESLSVEAECTDTDGASFTTWVDSLRPDRTFFRQKSGERVTHLAVESDAVWRIDAMSGETSPMPEAMHSFVTGHEFHLLFLELDRRFSAHRAAGQGQVGEETCHKVEMVDTAGRAASVCIADGSKLPLELTMLPPAEMGDEPIRIYPERWREIDGIRYFEFFRLEQGGDRFTYDYTKIRPNSVTPESMPARH